MGFFKHKFLILSLIINIFCGLTYAQVVIRELPDYNPPFSNPSLFDITQTRSIIPLNGNWKVYPADESKPQKVNIKIPSVFEGEGEFVFEKNFEINENQLKNNTFELVFIGLSYRADVLVNNIMIYRHAGGEFPFKIDLSRDILKTDSLNLLSVRLYYRLDSKNTIPLKQRFLFSKNYGGIVHDVYIAVKPDVSFADINVTTNLSGSLKEAKIDIKTSVVNSKISGSDTLSSNPKEFLFKAILYNNKDEIVYESKPLKFEVNHNKEKQLEQKITIKTPVLWSPQNPESYRLQLELSKEDQLIDVKERTFSVFTFKVNDDQILLNGKKFSVKGVTYIPEIPSFGDLMNYEKFESDIKIIKNAGFNTVRIAKIVPHPYVLQLCEQYGLITFIELPLGMIPESLSKDQNFYTRAKYFLSSYISSYKKYSSVVAVGLGSTYLSTIDSHRALLSNLAAYVRDNSNWLTYASFGNYTLPKINNLDLYGIELLNELPDDYADAIVQSQNNLGKGRLFISEATYTVNKGNTDGYVNRYSYEAQAKYFSDLIDYCSKNPLSGFFINSIFDFRGDYSSLLSGFNDENLYNIGLASENRETNRLSYKIVSSKLNEAERVTIPIGSPKDDAPMVFILFGLILAVLMGVLVNSGRKFREDASRALLRPYNFYADVRDQRIMSVYHSIFLGLIVIATFALVLGNLLYYLKTSVFFEKILLSFGSPVLIKVVNYLSWFPFKSVIWLFVIGVLLTVILILIIKVASLFIRTKVYLSSIFFTVIWAMLPVVFLIPVGIVLYRVLEANVVSIYVYLLIIAFGLWFLYRLLKGIYVIFDAAPGSVYFYSTLILLLFFGAIIFYYEIKNSTIQFMLFTLKQYNIFG